MNKPEIAIIGVSCRLPKGINNESEFWNALKNKKDLITEVSNEKFDKRKYLHQNINKPGKCYTFAAGIIEDNEYFDASFFNISKKEAKNMDPQQRIMLELSWDALENSGYNPLNLKGTSCGVYLGIYDMDHSLNGASDVSALESYSPMGGSMSIAANRISYFFDFNGASMAIDTACSSSMVALHQACVSIQTGENDMALVGGINLLQHPQPFIGLSKANMLSREGRCKSFSNSNNGYVRSEGAIVFILKSVKKAEQDKDLIKGVLLNTATNCDGKTNGLPLPSSEAQCRLMEKVYKEINLEPSKISYVEAHGTGTKVGDPVEIASISNALALKRNKKLPVGSVKSNLGHLEPAAGLAGLLKGLLCIKNRQIPATIHCQTLNPDIDFQKANIKIINEHCDIDESEQIIIGVNSFGFGGSNAHAVLAEYKEQSKLVKKTDCSKSVLPPFVLSANSEKSLKGLVSKYSKFIECEDLDLYDVAYNLFHNKAKLKFYIVVYGCHNRDDIISTLNSFLDNGKNTPNLFIGSKGKAKGKTGVVFSGNGCQWFGMGKNLLRCSSDIFGYMNDADNIFKELSGFSIIEKIQTETDEQLYSDTEIAQPALLIIQTALVRYLQANGMKFDAVIGHSVGEVAAAWACGALTLKEAVTLIYYKSKVQSRTRHYGKMAVIGCTYDEAKEVIVNLDIEDSVSIAGINSPALISLSGKEEFLNKIQDYCNAEEKYFQLLDLDYPFHSNYMDEIELDFKKLLSGHISPKSTNIDFVSTVYGKQVSGDKLDIDYWWNNIRKPVKFKDGIDELVNSGFANFIEIGTHPIMSRSIGQCAEELHKSVNLFSSVKKHSEEFYELNNSLFNLWFSDDNWNNRIFFPHEADRIALPGYVWDREKYRTVNSDESNGPSSIKLEHPLLGWRLAHNETIWENHLDATNCGELKDHVVGGILVFPAAGFIEMAVAANCLIHDNEVGYIDNMQMISPLILEEEVIRKVQLRVDENGYFNIRSRPRFTENEWAVHVSGRIVKKTYFTDIDGSKAENIFNNEPHHIFSSEEHYNFAKSVGLEYKDKFRTVDSIKFYEDRCKVKLINKLDKDNEYIFGPSLLDGGIHSLISLKCAKENFIEKTGSNSAFLPAGFDRILFKSNGGISSSVNINLLSQTKTSVKADITFYDEDNNILVKLFGARFNVAELINKTKLPTFYEYKPTLLYSYDTKIAKDIKNSLKDLFQHLKHFGTNDIENINNIIEQLFISYIIRAIKNIFPENNISVENEYTKYYKLNWALDILAAEEYLLKSDNNTLIWNKNKEIIVPETIFKLLVDNYSESLSISLLCSRLGQVMEKVLLGKLEINDFISDNKTLYEDIITNNILNSPSKAGFESCLYKLICSLKTDRKINVLEVGSGLYSSHIGNAANANTDNFNYNLASFAKNSFIAYLKKRINININVIEPENNFTGISVDQKFDLIICSDLYVFGDIAVATLNITKHLADGGILLLNESVPCVSQFFLNGLKPYFADKFLSSKNCGTTLYDFDEWKQLFTNLNLNLINKTFDFEDLYLGRFTAIYEKHSDNIAEMKVDAGLEDSDDDLLYLIVGRSDDERVSSLEKVIESNHKNSNIILYDKDITSYKEINYLKYSNIVFLPADKIDIDDVSLDCYIMDMVKEIAKLSVNRKLNISLVTSGGLLGNNKSDLNLIRNPKHASLWALMRVVSNEFNNFINVKLIDLQTVEINRELINLLENESEDELLLTEKSVYSMRVDKLLNLTDETSNEDQVVRLEINKKGSLNNLQWIEDSKQTLTENDVAFKPMAVGLNFRDIMYSLGLIPEEVVENSNVGSSLGLDVAGIVIDVGENVTKFKPGDRLMGGAPGSISNYNVFNQDSLFKLPDSWNFKDGATIFTVFFTAYCSLVHLARVRKGETLLIHGAAGGVGLAAIQISKYLGVEVYATAGSPEKRDFLRLMGVDHIYDSRSLKFMEEIKNDTEGKGVDVILNSLAAEAIEANLKLLKPFGRFVEMGKRDIYENYKMGLKPFRNNLSYFCINIEQITIWREELGLDIFKDLNKLFNEGVLKPLPYRIFKPEKVKEAFKYLQTARHIGKVVIDMEDSKITTGINKASKLSLSGTYLVTGGTNGFGLDTAKWLTEKGVKELILISRSGKINSEELDYFKNKNCNIILRSVDVNSQDQIKTLFQEIETLNIPLKGIIHAAAVYEDELIENLSESAYKKVLFTKIKGAYYLDKLSRKFNLEHFIVYSSVTALFGNIGQANYVAANGYLESLALERRRLGLNANYIALGGILDTGLLTRNASLKKVLTSQMGEGLITVEQALMALDCLISSPVPGFAVMNINVQQMEKTIPIFKTSRFDILRLTENKKSDSKNIDFKIYLKDLSYEEAKEEVLQIVREEIAAVLDISTDEINVKTLIKEFGFDSLMGFDLAVSIEKRIGVSIPPLSLQQTPNAEKIADILLPRLLDDHEEDDGEIETALYSKHGEE